MLGIICMFGLSWVSLWFGLVGFILIGIVMLLAILEPVLLSK
jgi:hypothetical protein